MRYGGIRTMRYRRPGRLTRILVRAFGLLLLVAAGWGGYALFGPDPSCGAGVERRGPEHECTGVTDGSVPFNSTLAPVFARIKAENDSVAGQQHVTTIATMVPMAPSDAVEKRQVLHEVQGAYLAQYRANHLSNGQAPAIRLLLANPGRNSVSWRPVADELAGLSASPRDNLRAVVGFDISVASTEQTIAYLTNVKGIPVVGGPMTADDIANSPQHPNAFKGLARITGNNSDHAAALAHFIKDVTPQESLVVEDLREQDNYIDTLRHAFEARTEGAPLAPEQFRSPADINTEGTLSNDFHQMVATICESPAKVIYFAGRQVQLRQFINELGNRGCTDNSYTVITGSGGSELSADSKLHWDALRRGVTVEYAADAHPDAWVGPDAPATGGSAADYHQLSYLVAQAQDSPVGPIGPVDLSDSRAIDEYDSMWTAVSAIRNSTNSATPIPSLSDTANAWLRLHGANRVDGASGWICLDNYGNPYDKAIAVVRLDPATHRIHFVGLAWPTGTPPATDCTAPGTGTR
jgi:hypothetical protein